MEEKTVEQNAAVEIASEASWVDTAYFSKSGKRTITYSDLDLARCRRLLDSNKNDLIMGLKMSATNMLTLQQILAYYDIPTLASLPISYSGLSEFLGVLKDLANKNSVEYNVSMTDILSYENGAN